MKKGKVSSLLVFLAVFSMVMTSCVPTPQATPAPAATQLPVQPATSQPTLPPNPAPTQPVSAGQVTLNIMDNWGNTSDLMAAPWGSVLKDFQSAYPNIIINEQVFPDTDIVTKVSMAFVAGQEPDLVFQNYPYGGTGDWVTDGLAIPVNDLMVQWGLKDKFLDVALAQNTDSQGHIVGFPMQGFTWPIWYNTKILNAAGVSAVPETVAQLIDAVNKVRAAGYQPLVVGGSDWSGQALFNLINATTMSEKEFADTFTSGEFSKSSSFVKSVDLFVQLRDNKVFVDHAEGLDGSAMTQMFYSGKAAMMMAGSWSYSELPKEMVQDVAIAGFPLPDGSPHARPIVADGYFGKDVWITRNGAKKIDAVGTFIKFLFQPQIQGRLVEQDAMVTTLKEVPVDQSKLSPLFVKSLNWGNSVTLVTAVDPFVPGTAWDDFTKVTAEAFLPGTPTAKIVTDLEQVWVQHKK